MGSPVRAVPLTPASARTGAWRCPSGPVCAALPLLSGNGSRKCFRCHRPVQSLLGHLYKCVSLGTNETESHLIHFSEESLSFQVLGHLHPEKCLHQLFTNVQLFWPICHFHGWPPRLINKQRCEMEREKDQKQRAEKGDSAHVKVSDSAESWEQCLSPPLSQIPGPWASFLLLLLEAATGGFYSEAKSLSFKTFHLHWVPSRYYT